MSQPIPMREQIDACRAGSDDLSLPDLAGLAHAAQNDSAVAAELGRAQRFDQAVTGALYDVPVPAGMLDRLLAAADSASSAAEEMAESAPIVEREPKLPRRPASRRAWLQAAVGVAALALVAVATAVFWPRPVRQISVHQLAAMAGRWAEDAQASDSGAWLPLKTPPELEPRGSVVLTGCVAKPVRTAEGWSGMVYRRTVRGQSVLVFDMAVPNAQFGVRPVPFTSLPGSRYLMGAWQTGGRLYVVVIEHGSGLQLEQLIGTRPTA